MARKLNFAQNLQGKIAALAGAADELKNLYDVYFDRGYNNGGADPIVDGDITATEITAADLGAAVTFIENLEKLLTNQDPINSDYDSVLNKVRSDI